MQPNYKVLTQNVLHGINPLEIIDLKGIDCKPGQPIAEVFDMDDTVLEIDNKSLSNRPDLWGHYGIARELSAIYNVPLKNKRRINQIQKFLNMMQK